MKIIECEQLSPEWWDARRGIPTASNFSRILTPTGKFSTSSDDYIAELIAEMVCLTPNYFTTQGKPVTAAMQHGTDTEPEARKWYEMDQGVETRRVGFITTDDGRWGCSPDALVDPDGGLEIKCVHLKTQVSYLLKGELPAEYRGQVHGSLLVTGRKWWDFLSYSPGLDPFLIRVYPDAYTVKLANALELFHDSLQKTIRRLKGPAKPAAPAPMPTAEEIEEARAATEDYFRDTPAMPSPGGE